MSNPTPKAPAPKPEPIPFSKLPDSEKAILARFGEATKQKAEWTGETLEFIQKRTGAHAVLMVEVAVRTLVGALMVCHEAKVGVPTDVAFASAADALAVAMDSIEAKEKEESANA